MVKKERRYLAQKISCRRPFLGERSISEERPYLAGSFRTSDRVGPVLYPREKLRYPIHKRVPDLPEFIGTHVQRGMAPGIVAHLFTFSGVG
jgi:hypothetical protein